MTFTAQIIAEPGDARLSRRERHVDLAALARDARSVIHKVAVSDLSSGGCRLTGAPDLAIGATVWIKIAGLLAKRATVIWSDQEDMGCEFVVPIEDGVLSDLQAGSHRRLRSRGRVFGTPSVSEAIAAPSSTARRIFWGFFLRVRKGVTSL